MSFRHARRFASEQAREICGDLYPGPILMPRGLLRSLDPILAIALNSANKSNSSFNDSFEKMLRGRPDGPLLLALWASIAAGEIPHKDMRKLLSLFPSEMASQPKSRGELLGYLHPRVSIIAQCMLALAQKRDAEALPSAERLGLGLTLCKLLIDMPNYLAKEKIYFPESDLKSANLTKKSLLKMVRTPEIDHFLAQQCDWIESLINEGLPVCDKVGARLRRGLLAAAFRAKMLLKHIRNPENDIFRTPPSLTNLQRWQCALRAWRL